MTGRDMQNRLSDRGPLGPLTERRVSASSRGGGWATGGRSVQLAASATHVTELNSPTIEYDAGEVGWPWT
ncbi:hypothetical protein SAMN05216266_109228 [Amycolatopsis marina]|uniref:Uncharacterized protein n=1 Tax=Amycolatopsis marina TaxID=490629 RepID=A0A1I1AJE3_9PSEU|nr:hypothetical protein SAMN05216266_109228 [Amycolatopsis marina]